MTPADDTEPPLGYTLTIEYGSELAGQLIAADIEQFAGEAFITRALTAFHQSVPEDERAGIRLIITADFVQSVNDRQVFDERTGPYSRTRITGIVAAKVMKGPDGTIDVLLPIEWFLPSLDQTADERAEQVRDLEHTIAHESVHARLDKRGLEPFFAYKRAEMPEAASQFTSCGASQIEEHLAEYISNHAVPRAASTPGHSMDAAFEAWTTGIDHTLRELPEADPDYFGKGMAISLTTANDLWKALAYLAAELRIVDSFHPVPDDIRSLPRWKKLVEPWWDEYTRLLGLIPMTLEQDVAATDAVAVELGTFLQRWFYGLGFDYHDTERGGYFRTMIWDHLR